MILSLKKFYFVCEFNGAVKNLLRKAVSSSNLKFIFPKVNVPSMISIPLVYIIRPTAIKPDTKVISEVATKQNLKR